jgi:hypothetical protein
MMSKRECVEMAQHGEVLTWSSDSEGEERDLVHQDIVDSEEPTELGVVWERYVIPETEQNEK